MLVRKHEIHNRLINVLDDEDLGSEFEEFRDYIFTAAPFHLSQADTYGSFYEIGAYWAYTVKPEIFENTELFRVMQSLVKTYFLDLDWKAYKIHVNAIQYGDGGAAHPDGGKLDGHNKSVTILVYLNKQWETDWSGETLFYDVAEEPIYAVKPKYKRVVMFDGDILHAARPPSKNCLYRRMVLVIKLSAKE